MSTRRDLVCARFDEGREYMENRIARGIEENRKGDLRIELKNHNGYSVPNLKIEVRQVNHDFNFGANCFMIDELETPEKNRLYKEKFAKLFNMATLPFYWNDLEPEEGKPRYAKDAPRIYRRPSTDLCLKWCKENDIRPKLHCLYYDKFTPDWVPTDDVEAAKAAYEAHFQDIAEHYADKIPAIEVMNETLSLVLSAKTCLIREPNLAEWAFKTARKYFPTNELIINEATEKTWNDYHFCRSNYYMQIQEALRAGTPIDGIGFQFHSFFRAEREEESTRKMYNPVRLYDFMDLYSDFNLPLSITEVTIPAYSNAPEDEALQAELLTTLYKIWFSSPLMESIIYWNIVDGYAAWAPLGDMTSGENYYYGALLRFDLSEKPAYQALYHLIHEEWHTEKTLTANRNGEAIVRGFYGEYDVTIAKEDGTTVTKRLHLKKGQDNRFTIIV